jgi:hypothetical protein
MSNIAVITTFPNVMFDVYAKGMLESFVRFWPAEIPLLVQLDDDLLVDQVRKILRPQDAFSVGLSNEHRAFVERNKSKDDPQNYRKQATRFSHKVFAIQRALTAITDAKAHNEPSARYLIWLDADVHMTRQVTMDEIRECLPKEGDAVSYLGRKDWDHSECGWLAFDVEMNGTKVIDAMLSHYLNDSIFNMEQWHDSWVFDQVAKLPCTNLTADKPGMDIWPHSPMGKWSIHFKGPAAKSQLVAHQPQEQQIKPRAGSNMAIVTKNSIPDAKLHANIIANQKLIKNWLKPCELNDEEIVVVSAGPSLIAEDVRAEAGKKVVAVKHALEALDKAGVVPWACILLDPRPHVSNFVEKPDTRVKWFVASQVDPSVTEKLLEAGCEVWGYHAAVGAKEEHLTEKQGYAIISGGSATATRGLYLLNHLGFKDFILYGYDLSYLEKPDLGAIDDRGQPKYIEMSVGFNHPFINQKRVFWTEPQFIAQFEEIDQILKEKPFKLRAYGYGMIPFIINLKNTGELRDKEFRAKLIGKKLSHYGELWNSKKKTASSTKWRLELPKILQKRTQNSN